MVRLVSEDRLFRRHQSMRALLEGCSVIVLDAGCALGAKTSELIALFDSVGKCNSLDRVSLLRDSPRSPPVVRLMLPYVHHSTQSRRRLPVENASNDVLCSLL
jgi:hypothetical protein